MLTQTVLSSEAPLIHSPSGDPPSETQRAREFIRRYDGVALGLGALGLIAFTYSLGSLINPFVLFLALYLILAPYREYRAARTMMWTGGVLFFLWFFWTTSSILIPFILAGVIAYLFNPFVTRLHIKFGIARIWSSIAIVSVLVGILAILGWLFVPTLVDQAGSLVTRLSSYISLHANQLDEKYLKRVLVRIGVPARTSDQLVTGQVTPRVREAIGQIPALILQLIESIPIVVERMLNYIIVPFAAIYLLRDWNKLEIFVLDMFPQRTRSRREATYNKIDTLLYRYVRGQITMAIIIGTIGMIAFWILGIPYYGLLGVVLMISDLIPIVGMIFSVVVVEIVILLTMQLSVGVILSGILVIGGLHTLEAYILGPKIVGEGIGIPPIIMILSLLIFGYFLGFLGLLIAVPSTSVIMMFVNEYRKQQTESMG
jgi:predicted PurR-regulated permease PerM